MKIQSKGLGFCMLILIFGGIGLTLFTGQWTTVSSKEPSKYKDLGLEEQYNPADIRGSYTFGEISSLFKIDTEILQKAFLLPEEINISEFASKNLEGLYEGLDQEIGNGSVQLFVALYLNLPYTLGDDYLPSSAVELIKSNNTQLTATQIEYLNSHSINLSNANINTSIETTETEVPEAENTINGQTTFKQILDLGLSEADIESVIGNTLPPTNTSIKDYCVDQGLSFSDVKEKLLSLIQ